MTQLDTMTREQLVAFATSQAEKLAKMQADNTAKLTCKLSAKGAVSVYGLGKWPVTLYLSQWERFLPFVKSGAVERFIEANRAGLSVKE